jgi:hypothetical protein
MHTDWQEMFLQGVPTGICLLELSSKNSKNLKFTKKK